MSCLCIEELPLSEQIEIQLEEADRLARATRALFAAFDQPISLDPSAPPPASPPVPALPGGSFLFNAGPAVPCPPSLLPVETAGAGTFLETIP